MPVRDDFNAGEFCWIDLNAHDLAAATEWYGKIFGWTHQVMETPGGGPPYAFFMHGQNVVGGIGEMSPEMKAQGIPPMWNSYVASEDCTATEARVKELGGTVTVPTIEIPGHGKLAFFLDPEGASFAAWQNVGDGPGVQVTDPVSLSWNELMTRDTSKAADFYGKLYGWDFAAMPMGDVEYVMIKNGGADAGGMMPMQGPMFDGIPAHWMVYFAVEDCDAAAATIAEAGGEIRVPPTQIPVGKFACAADPQGAGFSIITVTNQDC